MIEIPPDFVDSEYFVSEPDWHLKKGASEKLIKEFEEYENQEKFKRLYREEYPEMKDPYYEWTGKIVDKG